jgi:hypothetical protein
MESRQATRRIGAVICAVVNMLAGGAGVIGGSVLTLMCFGFGGTILDAAVPFAFAVGSLCYLLAGVFLLLPAQRGWKKALQFQFAAIALGAIYWLVMLRHMRSDTAVSVRDPELAAMIARERQQQGWWIGGINVYDEEVLMFFVLPGAALFLATFETLYVWLTSPADQRTFALRTLLILVAVVAIIFGVAFAMPLD